MVVSSQHRWVIHFQIPPPKYSGHSTLPLTPQGRETGDLRSRLTVIVCDFWEEVCCSYSIKHRSSVPSLWESRLVSIWARWDILHKLQAVCPKQCVLPAVSYFVQVTSTNAGRECQLSVNMNDLAESCWILFRQGESLTQKNILKCLSSLFFLNYPLALLARVDLGLSAAFEQPLSKARGL